MRVTIHLLQFEGELKLLFKIPDNYEEFTGYLFHMECLNDDNSLSCTMVIKLETP